MNFLAHLFLSGNHPQVSIGNFIGDYVKGKNHTKYSPFIQTGILCLLYTSPSPRDRQKSRMPSSA
jgi:acyl carrier protein phosphodiesterase